MGSPQDTCRRKIQNANILFGAINFRSTFGALGHLVLKHWEHPTLMLIDELKMIKTYKPSSNVGMQKG
jgi:hypothetical protein